MINIIEELVKIENKAGAFMQDSEEVRKALPKRIADFEAETVKTDEAEFQKQVKLMQEGVDAELKTKLAEVEADGRRKSAALEKDFAEHRSAWEEQIVRKILQG